MKVRLYNGSVSSQNRKQLTPQRIWIVERLDPGEALIYEVRSESESNWN